MRFEKAQDPANTVRGLARAMELLQELSPGIRLVGGVAESKREIAPPAPSICRSIGWIANWGAAIQPAEVRDILERLEFDGERAGAGAVPCGSAVAGAPPRTFRSKTIWWKKSAAWWGTIPSGRKRRRCRHVYRPPIPMRKFQHEVRNIFVDQGFTEVYNYSFLSEEAVRAFGFDPAEHVRVTNPIASDQALMRTSLLPGIWRNMLENAKHRESFRLFEIGLEIHKSAGLLPDEVPHLTAAIYERSGDGRAGLFEIKRAGECLLPGAEAIPRPARAFEHPARSADLHWRGQRVGRSSNCTLNWWNRGGRRSSISICWKSSRWRARK